MRVLVTGRGSIAKRHVRVLRELLPNADVAVLSATGDVDPVLSGIFGDRRLRRVRRYRRILGTRSIVSHRIVVSTVHTFRDRKVAR